MIRFYASDAIFFLLYNSVINEWFTTLTLSYRQIAYYTYSITCITVYTYMLYWQNICILVIVFIKIMHQEAFQVRDYFGYLPVDRVPYYWVTSADPYSLAIFLTLFIPFDYLFKYCRTAESLNLRYVSVSTSACIEWVKLHYMSAYM